MTCQLKEHNSSVLVSFSEMTKLPVSSSSKQQNCNNLKNCISCHSCRLKRTMMAVNKTIIKADFDVFSRWMLVREEKLCLTFGNDADDIPHRHRGW